ncbi:glutaminyl-peptide cyclotransferase [Desulfovibrio ferrophilus]|uniref:Glutaminyl-peptide cyclotransferase n=2 Tax=Desulfovibrio ferrophilus TaxID=241368 RepID=A0A2Z6AW44_9BACT|nr:glutaminyl-peptide cyclotransferase [Desulfovibrio ferrophilus]
MGPHVVWLTWTRQQAFIFDLESLEASGEFSYRGEGWGLASDGDRFMMSDGSSVISFRDPQTFVRHGEVQVTDGGVAVERLNELEWVSGVLYANVWRDSRIAVIDIRTGNVVRWLDLAPFHPPLDDPAAVLNGIAYDQRNDCLLVTGKLWPEMICVRPVH